MPHMLSSVGTASFGLTVSGMFRHQARYNAAHIALESRAGALTFSELDRRSDCVANALGTLGIGIRDCIAVLSENCQEFVEVQVAAAKLGAVVACQNWRLADAELEYCIELVAPKVLFVSERFAGRLTGISCPSLKLCTIISYGDDYEARLRLAQDMPPTDAAQSEDPWVILYTSGTTGLPKAATISQRAIIARCAIANLDGAARPGASYIAWAPMFHMASTDNILITLLNGGKVILQDGFDPEAIVHTITHQEVGALSLMPATIGTVIEAIKKARRPILPIMCTGAMADLVPPHQIAEITRLLNAPFRNTFGSTETGLAPASRGMFNIGLAPTNFAKTQSSLCEVRLLDIEGQAVPDGEPGEVSVRGPSLFSGYWNNPETNRTLFHAGWYCMGDVMSRNPDGTLNFVDRVKYLIKSGGENIYPAEIERILLKSSRIADVSVVRQPDDHWGEVPVAFVVAADPQLDAEAVMQLCRGRIANYKLPKRVIFIPADEVPRTPLGKIQRHLLEERLRSDRAANPMTTSIL